ncbi:MAG: tetratricopeptide repeat protein, partial [Verrucomicrobia bacterium]|nr:tetratricopeptide repeat protein [Verrucomicrobiota bacterium]
TEAKDFELASTLYEAACSAFPKSGLLLGGWSYSLAKLGRLDEAVTIQRRAVALDPDNPEVLSDLGWALIESGGFAEAEEVLRKAVALSPPDYDRPRHNLEELRRRMKT